MESIGKLKIWIAENAPMLQGVYQNKYAGMAYDRFASLPPKQQRQVLFGILGGIVGMIVLYVFIAYLSLFSSSSKANTSYAMVNMLLQYQKDIRDKGPQIQHLEKNNQLAGAGALKQALLDAARTAAISPKMLVVEEKTAASPGAEDTKGNEVQAKEATVSLQRVNLTQLKSFIQNVEFGFYNLNVSSLKIENDPQIRGYMKADLSVVAYLFHTEEAGL